MFTKKSQSRGFTLLEILLVVGIIAILAGIVIVAINPSRQLAQVRNTERQSDIKQINNAIMQYYIDHRSFPASVAAITDYTEICDTGELASGQESIDCDDLGMVDLSVLVPVYVTAIPKDPQGPVTAFSNKLTTPAYAATGGTGYWIAKPTSKKVVINSQRAELSKVIAIGTTTNPWAGGSGTSTPPAVVYTSCADILDQNPDSESGVFSIKPDGVETAFNAYCDMDFDGGGWTLVMNYNHQGGTTPTKLSRSTNLPLLSANAVGTDESGTAYWGEASPSLLSAFDFTTLRYEGYKSASCPGGATKTHIYTTNATYLNFINTGVGSLTKYSDDYFDIYSDHTADIFSVNMSCQPDSWYQNWNTNTSLSYYGNHSCSAETYYVGRVPAGSSNVIWAIDNSDGSGCGTDVGWGGNRSVQIKAWIR